MTQRKLAAVAIGAVTLLALTACGRADTGAAPESTGELSDGPATGTIEVWAQGTEAEALPELLKGFEEANPDVTVNVTAIPWDAALNKYTTAVAGGSTPDMGQLGTSWMSDFSTALQATPEGLDTSDLVEGAVKASEIGGVSYGLPWYIDARAIFYRTDLAEQAGYDSLPDDWEGFQQFTKDLQSKAGSEWGIVLPTSQTAAWQAMLPFSWSMGGSPMNEDQTEWTLDSPEMIEGYEYYQSFFTDGIANPQFNSTVPGDIAAGFVDGSTPVFFDGPYMMGVLAEVGGPDFVDKYEVAPLPADGTSFLGGSVLGVFKDGKNPDAAWKLAEYLAQPEVQVEWYELTGDLPSSQTAWADDALQADVKLAAFGTQIENALPTPNVTTWTQVSAQGDKQLEQISRTGKSVPTSMEELQKFAEGLGVGE